MPTVNASTPLPAKPTLSVKEARGSASSPIPLQIDAKAVAGDILSIMVGGLPDGASLSSGTSEGGSSWKLELQDLPGLSLSVPTGFSGTIPLKVTATSSGGQGEGSEEQILNVIVATDEFTPATTGQKIGLVVGLFVASILLLVVWFSALGEVQSQASAEFSVSWTPAADVVLKPGPPSFRYDSHSKKLIYHGLIDADRKAELAKLVPDDKAASQSADGGPSYWGAVDELAFDSNSAREKLILSLFLLGGISGVVGVLMRSIFNFVIIACFKNVLDWHRWWPWYIARPLLGFFLGLVCVLFIEADLFRPGGKAPAAIAWWVGIAILAGFGADDFVERLRLLSQTLFGGKSGRG
jgi:hypothetical protein